MSVVNLIENKSIWKTELGWSRKCPNCNSIIEHKGENSKYHSSKSFQKNIVCKSCSIIGRKHTDEWKHNMSIRMTGENHPQFKKHPTEDTLKKMSESHTGKSGYWKNKSLLESTKVKLSLLNKGKKLNDDTKEKIRIARCNQIKILGGGPMYNPKACEFIDKLNKEKGWNLQHAMNGGEVIISGYYVDGYDKERNIIFEYDEPHHKWNYKKQKEQIRQERIMNKINPSLFIRYDEKNNMLLDVTKKEK
jgi:hypothetical protein